MERRRRPVRMGQHELDVAARGKGRAIAGDDDAVYRRVSSCIQQRPGQCLGGLDIQGVIGFRTVQGQLNDGTMHGDQNDFAHAIFSSSMGVNDKKLVKLKPFYF